MKITPEICTLCPKLRLEATATQTVWVSAAAEADEAEALRVETQKTSLEAQNFWVEAWSKVRSKKLLAEDIRHDIDGDASPPKWKIDAAAGYAAEMFLAQTAADVAQVASVTARQKFRKATSAAQDMAEAEAEAKTTANAAWQAFTDAGQADLLAEIEALRTRTDELERELELVRAGATAQAVVTAPKPPLRPDDLGT